MLAVELEVPLPRRHLKFAGTPKRASAPAPAPTPATQRRRSTAGNEQKVPPLCATHVSTGQSTRLYTPRLMARHASDRPTQEHKPWSRFQARGSTTTRDLKQDAGSNPQIGNRMPAHVLLSSLRTFSTSCKLPPSELIPQAPISEFSSGKSFGKPGERGGSRKQRARFSVAQSEHEIPYHSQSFFPQAHKTLPNQARQFVRSNHREETTPATDNSIPYISRPKASPSPASRPPRLCSSTSAAHDHSAYRA